VKKKQRKSIPIGDRKGHVGIPLAVKKLGNNAVIVYFVGAGFPATIFKASVYFRSDDPKDWTVEARRWDGEKVRILYERMEVIEEDADLDRQTIMACLVKLERAGWCTCVKAPRRGRPGASGSAGVYLFHFEPAEIRGTLLSKRRDRSKRKHWKPREVIGDAAANNKTAASPIKGGFIGDAAAKNQFEGLNQFDRKQREASPSLDRKSIRALARERLVKDLTARKREYGPRQDEIEQRRRKGEVTLDEFHAAIKEAQRPVDLARLAVEAHDREVARLDAEAEASARALAISENVPSNSLVSRTSKS